MEVEIKQNSVEVENKMEIPIIAFPIYPVPLNPLEYLEYMATNGHY